MTHGKYLTLIREYDLTWSDRFAVPAASVRTTRGDVMLRVQGVRFFAGPRAGSDITCKS